MTRASITVTFVAEDRVLAAAAVNMVMDVYIKDQLGGRFRAVRQANEWLDTAGGRNSRGCKVHSDEDRIAALPRQPRHYPGHACRAGRRKPAAP